MGDIMNKNAYKKIMTFGILLTFLGLTLAPVMSAQTTESDYDLLIITPNRYTRALKSLVTHKNNVGVPARLATLSEVYRSQAAEQGRDKPEKIKYFIKTAVEEWGIKYVLLVGNFRQMPIRYCHNEEP
jgi:hypothetical protein